MKRILEEASKPGVTDPVTQNLGAYFGACMDEPAVDKADVAPIRGLLAKSKARPNPARALADAQCACSASSA
ncbi:MAG: hypothetical protein ABJB12_14090 [Pseudomonadota bacterium]